MKRTAIISVVALMALGQSAIAQDKPKTIQPGTEATPAMTEQVPTMKGGCPETAQVDTKARGTEATEAMSEQVPTMTPDEADCPEPAEAKSKDN
ncbi:MAG: hypothetical protein ACFCUR_16190 [Rhodomicrobiaceae bacterium]